jgi:hypothetical protein
MAISDVLTVELGSRPAIRTRSSNAQYSKLQAGCNNHMSNRELSIVGHYKHC